MPCRFVCICVYAVETVEVVGVCLSMLTSLAPRYNVLNLIISLRLFCLILKSQNIIDTEKKGVRNNGIYSTHIKFNIQVHRSLVIKRNL